MRPYYFYKIKRIPALTPGECVRNKAQMTFFGEGEDIDTIIKLEMKSFEGDLDLVRITSSIRHKTIGYVKTFVESKKYKIDFAEYLEPVDFPGYYHGSQQIMIFQAPRTVCNGVLAHLADADSEIELQKMRVDFKKLFVLNSEYLGAWFRGVSARVSAASLSGNQLQDDTLFKKLAQIAELSNVTIPWHFGDLHHQIMITNAGGIVLLQNYQNNLGLELRLIMDVYEKILKHVWFVKNESGDECEGMNGDL